MQDLFLRARTCLIGGFQLLNLRRMYTDVSRRVQKKMFEQAGKVLEMKRSGIGDSVGI